MNKQQKPYEGDPPEVSLLTNGIVPTISDQTFNIWNEWGTKPHKSSWWDNDLYNVLRDMSQDEINQQYVELLWLFEKDPKQLSQKLQLYSSADIASILDSAIEDEQLSTSKTQDSLIKQFIDYVTGQEEVSLYPENEYQTDEFNDLLGSLELLDNEENEDSEKLTVLLQSKRSMIDARSRSLIRDFFEVIKEEFPYDISAIKKQIEEYQEKNPTSLLWEYFKTFIPMK